MTEPRSSGARSELHLGRLELAPGAGLEPGERQPGVAAAVQADDRVPDRGEHALHLVRATLVQHELDAAWTEPAGAGRRGAAVVELDALAEPAERLVVRVALDLCLVGLLDAVARMGEPVREAAVVGQQERPGRVCVETPDGHDARLARDELDDGRPASRVAGGRHDARRLVEEHVREPLPRDLASVDLDTVGRDDEGVQLPRLAVDADAAGLDQLVGAATRGDAGPGEVSVESHSSLEATSAQCLQSERRAFSAWAGASDRTGRLSR